MLYEVITMAVESAVSGINMPFADVLHVQYKPGLMAGIILDTQCSPVASRNEFTRNIVALLLHSDVVRSEYRFFRPVRALAGEDGASYLIICNRCH